MSVDLSGNRVVIDVGSPTGSDESQSTTKKKPKSSTSKTTSTQAVQIVNSASAQPGSRQPRSVVLINGVALSGWLEWDVDNNTHRESDTFRVLYSCKELDETSPNNNSAWLTSQNKIQVQILVGFPQNAQTYSTSELASIVVGNCDELRYDPIQNTIELSGRDQVSAMIDTKTSEKFINQKASDIAKTIAGRHGLDSDIDDSDDQDGTFYEIDHARLNNAETEWDLLCDLADNNGYDVWVEGNTLKFKNSDNQGTGTYVIQWVPPNDQNGFSSCNVKTINFSRNNMLSKSKVKTTVRSFNPKQKQSFTGTATASKNNASDSDTQEYIYDEPGLTQDQVSKRARKRLKGIIQNEMSFQAVLPGDNILTTKMLIQVSGTGTAFDQTYWPTSIYRRFDIEHGYEMEIQAKNHSPETEVDS